MNSKIRSCAVIAILMCAAGTISRAQEAGRRNLRRGMTRQHPAPARRPGRPVSWIMIRPRGRPRHGPARTHNNELNEWRLYA